MNLRTLTLSLCLSMGLLLTQTSSVLAGDAPATKSAPAKLKKRKPVTCTGSKDIVLKKVIIETNDAAVTIMGSCDITIVDSVIKGRVGGLLIQGSGDITVKNSIIESATSAVTIMGSGDVVLNGAQVKSDEAAVTIMGSGDVEAKNTTFRGRKIIQGTGEYKDKGGNKWE